MVITNLQAQKMDNGWRCEYEYNEDMTASVKLYFGVTNGGDVGVWDEKYSEIVIPDYVTNPDDGERYTVTTMKKGADCIGWYVYSDNGMSPSKGYCKIPFKVYVPKTIKSIESKVFERFGYNEACNPTGTFTFYWEDERTFQYAKEYKKKMTWNNISDAEKQRLLEEYGEEYIKEIAPNFEGLEDIKEAFADDWFVESRYQSISQNGNFLAEYRLSWSFQWNVIRFNDEENTNIVIDKPSNESSGEVTIFLDDNVITNIGFPSWMRITTNNFRSASETVYIDTDFILSYTLEANTGAARSGNIVLTDNNGVSKIITVNQAGGEQTNISNVSVSNVYYRIAEGVIYFDKPVNDIRLYDLNGLLLYSNKYGIQLNISNNLKGVYLLKYDNKVVKIVF